jgi:pimeloyl-ACP methyl ester carboxylesterase
MAKYDLPAMLNFVLKKTKQPSLHYAAHSQGTMIAFAELSHNKDLANKVKAIYAMGPVTTIGYIESPIKFLADAIPELRVNKNMQLLTCT